MADKTLPDVDAIRQRRGQNDNKPNGSYSQDEITGVKVQSTKSADNANDRSAIEDAKSASTASIPAIITWSLVSILIFGGCCSNVYALEAIVKDEPDSGLLITFAQFVLTTLFTWPAYASISNPPTFLKPRAVPLRRWLPNIALFFTVNIMNNYAFSFNISVPVHIILRSGGSITTMAVGWVWGKRYSKAQIFGVSMLTVGVIIAAMADAQAKGKMKGSDATLDEFNAGLAILFIAQLLSAIMGVYVQNTYAIYGSHWRENLFYSHFLSIPLFAPFLPSLFQDFYRLSASTPVSIVIPSLDYQSGRMALLRLLGSKAAMINPGSSVGSMAIITMPALILNLILNALTQYACIRGVNLLGARTTALGVTIVLNLRKLVSLFLSIWLFGNTLPPGVLFGAVIVFSGAGVYAWGGTAAKTSVTRKSTSKRKET